MKAWMKRPNWIRSILLVTLFCVSPLAVDAADLPTIQRRGRLIVAVKANLAPLGFRDEQGQLQGFEIDVARQVAQELLGNAAAVEFKPVLNQDRGRMVLAGEVDFAIAQLTPTPSRLRLFEFSRSYYRDGIAIATADARLTSTAELQGQTIAVLAGSQAIEAVRRRMPSAVLRPVTSYQAAKGLLDTGDAQAIAADVSVLAGWVREFPQYRILPGVLATHELAIAFPRGQQYASLRQEVDQIVTRLHNSRWLETRAQVWGLPRLLSF